MSAAPDPQSEVRPLRVILREFVEHVVDGEDDLKTEELIAYAIKRFDHDQEFLVAAARDVIPVVVPEMLRDVIGRRKQEIMATPSGFVKRDKLELTARERLSKVFEGTGSGYKAFLTLKKRDLLQLNERDEKDIATRTRWVAFRADLAERMSDTQPVAAAFTSRQLEDAWKRHFTPTSLT